MHKLSPAQVTDLLRLAAHCTELGTDLVVIGAVAYQLHFPEDNRHTADIDLALALSIGEFLKLRIRLESDGWRTTERASHRWRTTAGTLLDLIPAGITERQAGALIWPDSGISMSLVGFTYVFRDAVTVRISNSLSLRVIPPPVVLFLKIVAFLENPHARLKDLFDIRSMLSLYESDNTDRLFGSDVLQAELADISLASAFLLGRDLQKILQGDLAHTDIVRQFRVILPHSKTGEWQFFKQAGSTVHDRTDEASLAVLDALLQGCGLLESGDRGR